ncbi:dynein axonemal heavy chain 12-like isoform X2 [Corticium candelabrum]|uniref:dynein axonemal heavy chain 12-like isoform X2 n=1 Tax=Corticium candelabrum TaxID=121492 RepID=UPI002E25286D|nr:dynein axonemal heavy chain 12-like isoform X2 [Corticium candelabrum]
MSTHREKVASVSKPKPGMSVPGFPRLPPIPSPPSTSQLHSSRLSADSPLRRYRHSSYVRGLVTNVMKERALKARQQTALIANSQSHTDPIPDYPRSMMSHERKVRENYEFLKKRVQDAPVTPMIPSVWDHVMDKVPVVLTNLPNSKQLIQEIQTEVSNDYEGSLRKFMVAQVLKKPNVKGVTQDEIPKDKKGLDFSTPWRARYETARTNMKTSLNSIHPTMQSVLALCHKNSSLLLVDLRDTRSRGAVECEYLRNTAIVECQKAEEKLMNSWFPEVASVFFDNKSLGKVNVVRFYECVDTLLSIQLQRLIIHSFTSWIDLFKDIHTTPVFKLQLVLDENQMQFYPSLDDLEDIIVFVVTTITTSLQKVPKMHGWITTGEATGYIDTTTEQRFLDRSIKELVEMVRENLVETKEHLESYSKYRFLINGEAEKSMTTFLEGGHTLQEYVEEIEKFKLLYWELVGLPTMAYFNMVELNCRDLKDGLVKCSQEFLDRLLSHLATLHRTENERVCREYESLKTRALTEPADNREMMELIDYMEKAKKELVPSLTKSVEESCSRLLYLLEVYTFRLKEVELNKTVLQWPKQIPYFFDENELIIEKAKHRGEDALMKRRQNVILDIEKCARCKNVLQTFKIWWQLSTRRRNCLVLRYQHSKKLRRFRREWSHFKSYSQSHTNGRNQRRNGWMVASLILLQSRWKVR